VVISLAASSLLTMVASGRFFGAAHGEGKISIILPFGFRRRKTSASCQQMSPWKSTAEDEYVERVLRNLLTSMFE
jgi:hypothetical protein